MICINAFVDLSIAVIGRQLFTFMFWEDLRSFSDFDN